jgi:uncharacterized membrane protein
MARFCESCGKEMSDAAAFCPSCGKNAGQPPAGNPGTGQAGSPAGLQSNLAGALAYLWITAIIFLLLDPFNKDKFVRFHSFQALFLGLTSIAGHIVLAVVPFLGWVLMPLWSLLILVLAVVGAVKAYQNKTWRIPVIGDFAEKQV